MFLQVFLGVQKGCWRTLLIMESAYAALPTLALEEVVHVAPRTHALAKEAVVKANAVRSIPVQVVVELVVQPTIVQAKAAGQRSMQHIILLLRWRWCL